MVQWPSMWRHGHQLELENFSFSLASQIAVVTTAADADADVAVVVAHFTAHLQRRNGINTCTLCTMCACVYAERELHTSLSIEVCNVYLFRFSINYVYRVAYRLFSTHIFSFYARSMNAVHVHSAHISTKSDTQTQATSCSHSVNSWQLAWRWTVYCEVITLKRGHFHYNSFDKKSSNKIMQPVLCSFSSR